MLFLESVQLYFREGKKVLARVKSFLAESDWYTGSQSGFFSCATTACRQRLQAVYQFPPVSSLKSGHHPAVTNAPGAREALLPTLHFEEPQGK